MKGVSNCDPYCYFLEAFYSKRMPSGYFKVGVSVEWESRIKTIRSGTPFEILQPVYVIQSPDSCQLEQLLLKEFQCDRQWTRGEWFLVGGACEDMGGIDRAQKHREVCNMFKEEIRNYMIDWAKKSAMNWVFMP